MTKDKDTAEKIDIHGALSICLGAKDSDAICQIHLVKSNGQLMWRPPHIDVIIGSRTRKLPVFKGQIAHDISEMTNEIQALIKKTIGKLEYGHKYRIMGNMITDETDQ